MRVQPNKTTVKFFTRWMPTRSCDFFIFWCNYYKGLLQFSFMLFVSNRPTNILLTEDRKILVLTKYKILFTTLDFIQEYLSASLAYHEPIALEYSKQLSQVLVLTPNSIELYFCDWMDKVQTKKIIILNDEPIRSMRFKDDNW